jgi:hypothetical protein
MRLKEAGESEKRLMLWQRSGLITIWSDTDLNAVVEWEREQRQHLEKIRNHLPNFVFE